MGGRIPDEEVVDSFAAEANAPIEPSCDSTVQQLDSYAIAAYKKRKTGDSQGQLPAPVWKHIFLYNGKQVTQYYWQTHCRFNFDSVSLSPDGIYSKWCSCKPIKIQKSNGAIANQFNDHSPTLLHKPPCDTVYINSGTVRVTKVIHDTIYLAAPVPNQPTYIK